jgi:hypothetical protein
MRRKLALLTLALASVLGALMTSGAPRAEAGHCNGVTVCCPNTGCFCCANPCFFVCGP